MFKFHELRFSTKDQFLKLSAEWNFFYDPKYKNKWSVHFLGLSWDPRAMKRAKNSQDNLETEQSLRTNIIRDFKKDGL